MIRFEEHLDIYSFVLEEELIQYDLDWISTIHKAINDDEYVLFYFNWGRIPRSNLYLQGDLYHEAIVYGYNDKEKYLDVIAFEVDGKRFGTVQIGYDEFVCETERVQREKDSSVKWFAHYGFPVTRIKRRFTETTFFDYRKFYFDLERGSARACPCPLWEHSYASGMYVYDLMARYFIHLFDTKPLPVSEYELWSIMNFKMICHRRLMLQRLKMINSDVNQKLFKQIYQIYSECEKGMKLINRLTIKYKRTNDRDNLIKISELFQKNYQLEKRAVPMLKEYLVHAKLGIPIS